MANETDAQGNVTSGKRGRWLRVVVVGALLLCLLLFGLAFARTVNARFEWNAVHGFNNLEILDLESRQRVGGAIWQVIVAAQVKPVLSAYLRRAGFERARGDAFVRVGRIVPIARPEGWGSDGMELDTDVTPLMRAAEKGDLNSVKRLLTVENDVNAMDWLGRTALLHACSGDINADVVRSLLDAGAKVNVSDKGGTTPLIGAVIVGRGADRISIIHELLAAGADVNAKNVSGGTALMVAAANGDGELVTILLRRGARLGDRTAAGMTALSLAQHYNHPEIAELLKQAGAQR